MESSDRCNVCGVSDMKLVDGFYYCNECGTQNTNVRETVLEERTLADGTFAHTAKRKIVQLKEDGIESKLPTFKSGDICLINYKHYIYSSTSEVCTALLNNAVQTSDEPLLMYVTMLGQRLIGVNDECIISVLNMEFRSGPSLGRTLHKFLMSRLSGLPLS